MRLYFAITWLVVYILPHLVFSAKQSTQGPLSQTCSGVPGVPGVPGLNGRDGAKGDQGSVGAPGKKGPRGPAGPPGKTGAKGSQGEKGEKAALGVVPERNWKQCTWKKLNDNRDFGFIKDCVFVKKADETALKVDFDVDFRVGFCKSCCKRWYFTFNGIECSKPATIEGIDAIHQNHGRTDTNVHKHSQIGGYCEGFGKGTIRVGLVVGDCDGGFKGGNAHTGWNCVSRIMIEEVPPPQ